MAGKPITHGLTSDSELITPGATLGSKLITNGAAKSCESAVAWKLATYGANSSLEKSSDALSVLPKGAKESDS